MAMIDSWYPSVWHGIKKTMPLSFDGMMNLAEAKAIYEIGKRCNWNKVAMSKEMCVNRKTVYRKLQKYFPHMVKTHVK